MERKLRAVKLGFDRSFEERLQRKEQARNIVKDLTLIFVFISWLLVGVSIVAVAVAPSSAQSLICMLIMLILVFVPMMFIKQLNVWGVIK